jgi:uncharacterized membrane protein YhdT
MGIARKVGKAVGGFVFTLSLSFLIFSMALVQLTEYENMKAFFSDIFSSHIEDVDVGALFDNIYYKEFDCGFVECVQAGKFDIMLSAQGHEFFNGIKMYLIAAVVVSAVMIFVSAETWLARMKGFGVPLLFIGLSYVMINLVKSNIISQFPFAQEAEQIGISVAPIVNKIVAPMLNSFLIALVVGAVLTAGTYALEYKEKRRTGIRKPTKK